MKSTVYAGHLWWCQHTRAVQESEVRRGHGVVLSPTVQTTKALYKMEPITILTFQAGLKHCQLQHQVQFYFGILDIIVIYCVCQPCEINNSQVWRDIVSNRRRNTHVWLFLRQAARSWRRWSLYAGTNGGIACKVMSSTQGIRWPTPMSVTAEALCIPVVGNPIATWSYSPTSSV